MDLDLRKDKALELHKQGYNCAQCVILSFPDITNLTDKVAAQIAMGLGGGVGAQGEICGVLLGMTVVLGLARDANPMVKPQVNAEVRELTNRFKEKNQGCFLCRELKSKCRRPCDDLICGGIEILDAYLKQSYQ